MNDLADFLAEIRLIYQSEGMQPGVLKKIIYGPRWLMVLATAGQWGIAFNFTGEHEVHGRQDASLLLNWQAYVGRDLFTLAEALCQHEELILRSFCLAVLNALSRPFCLLDACTARGLKVKEANHDFHFLQPGEKAVIVGYGGLASSLRQRLGEIHICEMRPLSALQTLTIGENIVYGPTGVHFHAASSNSQTLADADALFLSGCTLVNGTWQQLIRDAKRARIIGMFGPSAQLLPECLLTRGIHYLHTTRIDDGEVCAQRLADSICRDIFQDIAANYVIQTF